MWTVSHPGDITSEMRAVIADPLETKLIDPQLPRLLSLKDGAATGAELLAALHATKPGLIVTSSHGLAEGTSDVLRAGLGLPIDLTHTPVPRDELGGRHPWWRGVVFAGLLLGRQLCLQRREVAVRWVAQAGGRQRHLGERCRTWFDSCAGGTGPVGAAGTDSRLLRPRRAHV